PVPKQPERVTVDVRRLYAISPAGTLACLGTGLANGAFWALAPAFVVSVTHDASHAALFMTANVLGGAVFQWPIGHLSDRVGRRGVLVGCALTAAVIAVTLVWSADVLPFAGLLLLGAAWGAVSFPQYPVAVANTNDHADPSEYVMVSSGLLLMYGVGAIAGPLLASGLMTLHGPGGLYVFTGCVHVLVVTFILFRVTQRAGAPQAQHVDFNESVVAAGTTSQVYEEEARAQRAEHAT
ncbi:MAG TPA: MFS transporter, partial [Woeseiaceae bacterium]|nr:MFS transporter [Woeseiaceae bacterium]